MSQSSNNGQAAYLRILSYNIRKCLGTDRKRNPQRILKVLNEINADIVVLQEADLRFGSRQSAIPQTLIESMTNYRAVPLDVQRDSMGWHGNAILVRQNISVISHDIIHIPYIEPRGVVSAILRVKGQDIAIFGMHLDLSGLWRRRQARAITKYARDALNDYPTLLAGDLNEWSANGGCLREFGRYFEVLDCGRSYHSARPIGKLDRIIHSPNLRPSNFGVYKSEAANKASDHLPIWADFIWPNNN